MHSVLKGKGQPADKPRFSIVLRAILPRDDDKSAGEHWTPIDEAKQAEVRPGGKHFHEYVPLLRRAEQNDTEPMETEENTTAPQLIEAIGGDQETLCVPIGEGDNLHFVASGSEQPYTGYGVLRDKDGTVVYRGQFDVITECHKARQVARHPAPLF